MLSLILESGSAVLGAVAGAIDWPELASAVAGALIGVIVG